MFKNYSFLTLALMLTLQFVSGQEIDWKSTNNWKLYNIHSQSAAKYRLDTLQYFQSIQLNMDTIHNFLASVAAWPPDKYSMWMGSYVATCELADKKPRKILISTYGGFFYDQTAKKYYQVSENFTRSWLEFLNAAGMRIN